MTDPPATPPAPTRAELFLQFLWVGVRGFGGVFVMGRRMLVEEQRWLTPQEFVEVLGVCQFLPGANMVNVSVAVGARYGGWTGSLCALSGILAAPCCIAVALTALYERFSVLPLVNRAMGGVAAAASGLVIGAALKMAGPVLRGDPVLAVPVVAGVLAAAGLLHWPLPLVLAAGAPGAARMNELERLWALGTRFAILSVLAVGGVNAVTPEIHRQAVEVSRWMTDRQFAELFAVAQAAPGPNMMISTVIGWHVAGGWGALVATLAMCGPSSLGVYVVSGLWRRWRDRPWRVWVEAGIAPVVIGLIGASGYLLAKGATSDWGGWTIAAASAALIWRTRINPLWMLGAAALLGVAGFV